MKCICHVLVHHTLFDALPFPIIHLDGSGRGATSRVLALSVCFEFGARFVVSLRFEPKPKYRLRSNSDNDNNNNL